MLTEPLGSKLSLLAGLITTSYTAGTACNGGNKRRVRFIGQCVSVGGTGMTAIKFKAQASRDGATWFDVMSTNDVDINTPVVEHTLTVVAATTQQIGFVVDGTFPYFRCAAKAVTAAGTTAEAVTALAWAMPS